MEKENLPLAEFFIKRLEDKHQAYLNAKAAASEKNKKALIVFACFFFLVFALPSSIADFILFPIFAGILFSMLYFKDFYKDLGEKCKQIGNGDPIFTYFVLKEKDHAKWFNGFSGKDKEAYLDKLLKQALKAGYSGEETVSFLAGFGINESVSHHAFYDYCQGLVNEATRKTDIEAEEKRLREKLDKYTEQPDNEDKQ